MSSKQNSKHSNYKDKGRTGLANLGNTCFMNSVLQCLSHTYELNDFLNKKEFQTKLRKKEDSLILMEWDKLRTMMWSENCIISPGGFLDAVQKVSRIKKKDLFTGYAQNDFSEFLVFVMECFHNSIMREVDMKIKGDVLTSTDELAKKCFNMIKTYYKKEYSEIFEMFYGIHVSKVVSECKTYTNTTPESFFLLTLPIPCKNANLIQCLDEYTAIETLDGDNMLQINDEGTKAVCKKQILFWSFPQVLVVMLKRFGNNLRKNKDRIDFPLVDLDLSKYTIGYDRKSYVYDLYGICNHSGGVLGGHYWAYVKNANGKWYNFNDTQVSEINQNSLITEKAYCLFYRKKY